MLGHRARMMKQHALLPHSLATRLATKTIVVPRSSSNNHHESKRSAEQTTMLMAGTSTRQLFPTQLQASHLLNHRQPPIVQTPTSSPPRMVSPNLRLVERLLLTDGRAPCRADAVLIKTR